MEQVHVNVVGVAVDGYGAHGEHLEQEDSVEGHPGEVEGRGGHVRDGLVLDALQESCNISRNKTVLNF